MENKKINGQTVNTIDLNPIVGLCFDTIVAEKFLYDIEDIDGFKMITLTGGMGMSVLLSEKQLESKTITIYVPKEFFGMVVGRGGQNIKYTIETIKREYPKSKVEFIKVMEKSFDEYPKTYPFKEK